MQGHESAAASGDAFSMEAKADVSRNPWYVCWHVLMEKPMAPANIARRITTKSIRRRVDFPLPFFMNLLLASSFFPWEDRVSSRCLTSSSSSKPNSLLITWRKPQKRPGRKHIYLIFFKELQRLGRDLGRLLDFLEGDLPCLSFFLEILSQCESILGHLFLLAFHIHLPCQNPRGKQ